VTARRERLPLPAILLLLAAQPGWVGCQAGYVLQQGLGQLALARRQVPIAEAEAAAKLSPREIEMLRWVERILAFAREELGLDPGDSYTTYIDTGGEPISHVVVAASRLAMAPLEWRFPFVGRVAYKGFFQAEDAHAEARSLAARGYDTAVLRVGAYSTLGWFRDPVLSTMLALELPELAELLFHEITHRTVYIRGDTSFNESLASHVAFEGTVRFLAAHSETEPLLAAYLAETESSRQVEVLLSRLRTDLEALYGSDLTNAAKLARKAEVFASASRAYRRLQGAAPDAGGPAFPASNAYVLACVSYQEHWALLARLQDACGGQPRHLVSYLKALSEEEALPTTLQQ
jgi:predicted aminopeptidase